MDKIEQQDIIRTIRAMHKAKDYHGILSVAKDLDPEKIKDRRILEMIADAYNRSGLYKEAREDLLIAYERNPGSRGLAYKLAIISVKLDNLDDAVDFYEDFCRIAPSDNNKYILKYIIGRAGGIEAKDLIRVLEQYNERESDEKWLYELARLYHEVGRADECVALCDEIALWYADGEYEKAALELKFMHKALSASQQARYEQIMSEFVDTPAPEASEEERKAKEAAELDLEAEAESFVSQFSGEKKTPKEAKKSSDAEDEVLFEEAKGKDPLVETFRLPTDKINEVMEQQIAASDPENITFRLPTDVINDIIEEKEQKNRPQAFAETVAEIVADIKKNKPESAEPKKEEAEPEKEKEAAKPAKTEGGEKEKHPETPGNTKEPAEPGKEEAGPVKKEETEKPTEIEKPAEAEVKTKEEQPETPEKAKEPSRPGNAAELVKEENAEKITGSVKTGAPEKKPEPVKTESAMAMSKLGVTALKRSSKASLIKKPALLGKGGFVEQPVLREKVDTSNIPVANERDGQVGINLNLIDRNDTETVEGQLTIDEFFERYADRVAESSQQVAAVEAERLKQVVEAVKDMESTPLYDMNFDTPDRDEFAEEEIITIVTEDILSENEPEEDVYAASAEPEKRTEPENEEDELKGEPEAVPEKEAAGALAAAAVTEAVKEENEAGPVKEGSSEEETKAEPGAEQINAAVPEAEAKEPEEGEETATKESRQGIQAEPEEEEEPAVKEDPHQIQAEPEVPKEPKAANDPAPAEEKEKTVQKAEAAAASEENKEPEVGENAQAACEEPAAVPEKEEASKEFEAEEEPELLNEDFEAALAKFVQDTEGSAEAEAAGEMPEGIDQDFEAALARFVHESAEDGQKEPEAKSEELDKELENALSDFVHDELFAEEENSDGASQKDSGSDEEAVTQAGDDAEGIAAEGAAPEENGADNAAAAAESEDKPDEENKESKEGSSGEDFADLVMEGPSVSAAAEEGALKEKTASEQDGFVISEEFRDEIKEFLLIDGIEDEIRAACSQIAQRKRQGDTSGGNLIVTGDKKCGKTYLAIAVIKAVIKEVGTGSGKVVKVQAQPLNGKNISAVLKKVEGRDLIIENVGYLKDETIRDLIGVISSGEFRQMIVLEGNMLAIENIITHFPEIKDLFGARIDIQELSITQWAKIAKKYAKEQGYGMDEMAELALHARIDKINVPSARLGLGDIRDIIDSAIAKASKRNNGKLFAAFSKKNRDEGVLTESDFLE